MHGPQRTNSRSARALLASAWGVVCALMLAAPALALRSFPRAASILYLVFSPICHQNPQRSFMLAGHSLAVCHRCTGMYLGLFLGSLIGEHAGTGSARTRRIRVLAATLPLLLDVLAPAAGLWPGAPLTRFSTGLLFGFLISGLLVRGVAEFLQEAPWRRFTMPISQLKGDLS
jgi:uncharacterized membrane protein